MGLQKQSLKKKEKLYFQNKYNKMDKLKIIKKTPFILNEDDRSLISKILIHNHWNGLTLTEFSKQVGISRRHLYNLMTSGGFTKKQRENILNIIKD